MNISKRLQTKFTEYYTKSRKVENTTEFWHWFYAEDDRALKGVVENLNLGVYIEYLGSDYERPGIFVVVGGLQFEQVSNIMKELTDFINYINYMQQNLKDPEYVTLGRTYNITSSFDATVPLLRINLHKTLKYYL